MIGIGKFVLLLAVLGIIFALFSGPSASESLTIERIEAMTFLTFLMVIGIGFIVWGIASKVEELANKIEAKEKESDKKEEED